jgi:DNA ligase-1
MKQNILQHIDLFARDIHSDIKHWSCSVYEEEGKGVILVKYGVLFGNRAERITIVTKGKNIGKSNETTPISQAIHDADGKILNKRREGYKSLSDLKCSNIEHLLSSLNEEITQDIFHFLEHNLPADNTDMEGNAKPMKAQPYLKDDNTPRISFPCIGQAKINGFRCFSSFRLGLKTLFGSELTVQFLSKRGLDFIPLPIIEKELLELYNTIPDNEKEFLIFDGEMFIPNQKLETISSAVRKRNELTNSLEFHIFDLAVPNLTQKERVVKLSNYFKNSNKEFKFIKRVPNVMINSHAEAVIFKNKCIQEGHEGAIFRDLTSNYQFGKRPKTMVKFKDRESSEFLITNIIDSDKNPGIPIFVCKNDINDENFEVVIEGTLDERRQYFTNKEQHIGKYITVEYYERTKKGVPFHAIGVAVRDYE